MRIINRLILTAILISFLVVFAQPCEIHFSPEKVTAVQGIETKVTVTVVLEHRNCKIPMEQTVIEGKGLTILQIGNWTRVKADTYSVDITFILNGPKGEIRVTRECDKKGLSEGILKVVAQ